MKERYINKYVYRLNEYIPYTYQRKLRYLHIYHASDNSLHYSLRIPRSHQTSLNLAQVIRVRWRHYPQLFNANFQKGTGIGIFPDVIQPFRHDLSIKGQH